MVTSGVCAEPCSLTAVSPEWVRQAGQAGRGGATGRYAGADDGIDAQVLVTEPTGPETLLYVAVAGTQWNVTTRGHYSAARPHDRLGLSPQPDRIHLFDRHSGRRLDA